MKPRSLGELSGWLAIAVPGGIGLWIVGRTLTVYWRHDVLASLIVGAIGAALLVALIELSIRLVRAGMLERELRALPAKPSEATLDMASPLVSAMLRARLEQAPLPGLGENIAPFMTGLLVMLGLLGTLLGLFQTVHGAGQALTSSADIEALRRSLSAPIDGLTRSFGCSAAGISASAMLGLAVALVRRREASAMRVFHTYAAGPLRVLSPVRRQMLALEQLVANHSLAVPGAASAIEAVGSKLDALSSQLVSMQQTALKTQQGVFSELLANARAELSTVAADVGQALHDRVGPLLEQMATRSSEALAAQAAALANGASELTRELDRDRQTRQRETMQALQALREHFDAAEAARAAAHARELEALMAAATRALGAEQAREEALGARWQELITRLDAQHSDAQKTEAERLRSLDVQVNAARERETEQLTRIDALVTRVGAELEQLASALRAQLEQQGASERDHEERSQRTFAQLEAGTSAWVAGIARQESALEQLVTRLPERFESAVQSSHESAQRALAQLVEVTEQRLTLVSELLADGLGERQSSAREIEAQAKQALAAAQASATSLESLIERVSGMLPELIEAAQSGASATLSKLRESADQQAERFAELETSVTRGRDEHAQGLAEQLAAHAAELEQRLAKTSSAVQEAAAIWQASSAEMQAVAELFASSVERQREASDAWLESLGEVEGAVERAGRDAARDALSDQLASTQEVFARQLQFQRELFEQLRTLRSAQSQGTHTAHGEQDVSF